MKMAFYHANSRNRSSITLFCVGIVLAACHSITVCHTNFTLMLDFVSMIMMWNELYVYLNLDFVSGWSIRVSAMIGSDSPMDPM